jgi:hypothetical protein
VVEILSLTITESWQDASRKPNERKAMATKYYNSLKQAHSDQQRINNLSDAELRDHVNNESAVCLSLEGSNPTDYHLAIRGAGFKHLGTYQK